MRLASLDSYQYYQLHKKLSKISGTVRCIYCYGCDGCSTSFHDKYKWLLQHFPFLDPQHFVLWTKNIVKADYLIDDNPRQLAILKANPLYTQRIM